MLKKKRPLTGAVFFSRKNSVYHLVRRLFRRVLAQRTLFRGRLGFRVLVLETKTTLLPGFFQCDGLVLRILKSLAL